jgi:hypothetical protein
LADINILSRAREFITQSEEWQHKHGMQNHVISSSDIKSTLLQVVYLVDLISIDDKQRIEKKTL